MTEIELIQQHYEELKEVCQDLAVDVESIDLPLTKRKKESLKAIIPQETKKTWWIFAI